MVELCHTVAALSLQPLNETDAHGRIDSVVTQRKSNRHEMEQVCAAEMAVRYAALSVSL